MRTIANMETIKIKVSKDDLIEGKWLNFMLLSKKISEIEEEKSMARKALKTRLYNSDFCKKYNTKMIAGIKCLDADCPMKEKTASLVIEIERV